MQKSDPSRTLGARPDTLVWLRDTVRQVLRLSETDAVDTRTLPELGGGSVQAIALQFRILQETSTTVEMHELAGSPVADIAASIDARRPAID